MWSALADGFSEFASVVSQDAKKVYTSVQNTTSSLVQQLSQEEQDDLIWKQRSGPITDDEDQDQDDAQNDDDNQNNGNNGESFVSSASLSPGRFLARIPATEFAKDLPTCPSSDFSEWTAQVRALQQNIDETFKLELEDDEANMFTPHWLRAGVDCVDPEGIPNDSSERQLFAIGQSLLQNCQTVRDTFVALFPEARNHSLETLQDTILDVNSQASQEVDDEGRRQNQASNDVGVDVDGDDFDNNKKRLLPSSFLVRYFVRLNKLFFLFKRREFQERAEKQEARNKKKRAEAANDAAVIELSSRLVSVSQDNEDLKNLVARQQQQIQDQDVMLTEYKVRSSDLIQEVDRLKGENSEQEKVIRLLRLDVERSKVALVVASAANANQKTIADTNTSTSTALPPADRVAAHQSTVSSSSSSVDMVGSSGTGSEADGDPSNHKREHRNKTGAASGDVKKNHGHDDNDDEGWTDIA